MPSATRVPAAGGPARRSRPGELRRAGGESTPSTRRESSQAFGRGAACCAPTLPSCGLFLQKRLERGPEVRRRAAHRVDVGAEPDAVLERQAVQLVELLLGKGQGRGRSEERRVGKEW